MRDELDAGDNFKALKKRESSMFVLFLKEMVRWVGVLNHG
jgi:hypothetical protein